MARAFGTVGPVMHVQQSVKSVRRRQIVRTTLKEFEDVSAVSNRTEREDMVVSQNVFIIIPTG